MVTPLKQEWASKLHMCLGYHVVEDDESLRALNACIKAIIQSAKAKKKNKEGVK